MTRQDYQQQKETVSLQKSEGKYSTVMSVFQIYLSCMCIDSNSSIKSGAETVDSITISSRVMSPEGLLTVSILNHFKK